MIKRRPTIHDVAREARVSFKTVSRVVNNEANVSPETKKTVFKAIKTLSYSPSVAARVLAGKRSFLIGLFYDTPTSYYTSCVQVGALEKCRSAGFHLILEFFDSAASNAVENIIAIVKNTRIDGVILTSPVSDNKAIRDVLVREKIAHVFVSPPKLQHQASYVYMDQRRAAFDVTNYLISLGHKRIAFIKGHPRHCAVKLRLLGYQDALKVKGIGLDKALVKPGNFRFQSGVDAAEELLRQKLPPTAIFSANDEMAAGVVAAAHRLGISIPGNLSVAGFDDVPFASITWPALTTIRQPIIEMAARAAELLLDQIQSKTKGLPSGSSSILFPYEIIIRESTGPAPQR